MQTTSKTVHFLPLEPIAARYTEQMLRWVVGDLESTGLPYVVYLPDVDAGTINTGEFLDDYTSLQFKQAQLSLITKAFQSSSVQEGDVILLGDLWYVGIEGLRMLADLAGIKVTIAGWHYAGVYDPNDYYSKKLTGWSRAFETMVVRDVADFICCGSEYHKNLIVRNTGVDPNKVLPLGLSFNSTDVAKVPEVPKSKIVVFPHRLAEEKAPEHFIYAAKAVRRTHPEWSFVFSCTKTPPTHLIELNKDAGYPCSFAIHEGADAKQRYYSLLREASIVYSSGYQETFGYAVNEAMVLGCLPCLPNRACYAETVLNSPRFLYGSDDPWGISCLLGLITLANSDDTKSLPSRFDDSTIQFLARITN